MINKIEKILIFSKKCEKTSFLAVLTGTLKMVKNGQNSGSGQVGPTGKGAFSKY